jgi:hypothetical protein
MGVLGRVCAVRAGDCVEVPAMSITEIERLQLALAEAQRLNKILMEGQERLQEKLKGQSEALSNVIEAVNGAVLNFLHAMNDAKAGLRKTAAYPEFCSHPEKCQNGRCEREHCCND